MTTKYFIWHDQQAQGDFDTQSECARQAHAVSTGSARPAHVYRLERGLPSWISTYQRGRRVNQKAMGVSA
jgi:hypothetical protein